MNIIHVVPSYPPCIGGVEYAVRNIAERQADLGHSVTVYTSNRGVGIGMPEPVKNLKIYYLPSFNIAHTLIIPSLFFQLLLAPKDSIIHLHVAQAYSPEIVYLIAKIRRIPYVVHLHTDVGPSGKAGVLLPVYKSIILKRILKFSNKLIVLNNNYKMLVNSKYKIFNNIHIIPNGIGEEYFVSKQFNNKPNINILYVGRLTVEKNIPLLIEAIKLVKSKVILHIVGDGEKKNDIDKIISEKGLKNVVLHGILVGKEKIRFYQNADIFMLVSEYEGLPLVLLEAMASGTPIIASDVIGINELVEDEGLLVKQPTPEKLATSIDSLIKNRPLRMLMSKAGINKARNYSWNKVVKDIESIYMEVRHET